MFWIGSLEAEEDKRLSSLLAAMDAFNSEQTSVLNRVNGLLVAAFQGQVTLMRSSRVFPERSSGKCTNVAHAVGHGLTAALAHRLRQSWRVLGVTDSTLKALLRQVIFTVGRDTREERRHLFTELVPRTLRRGIAASAHAAFAVEGARECRPCLP